MTHLSAGFQFPINRRSLCCHTFSLLLRNTEVGHDNMVSPSKRKKLPGDSFNESSPRRSRRIANMASNNTNREYSSFSTLSSQLDADESWSDLRKAAKERVQNYQPAKRPNEAKLVPTLEAFLDWLPQEGKESIAKDITAAQTDDALWEGFQNLVSGLLYPMKARSTRNSVTSSPHSHRRLNAEIVAGALTEPQTCDDRFREDCLRRDGSRCVICQSMSIDVWKNLGQPTGVRTSYLDAAHIIPFSYASWNKTLAAPHSAADAWEVLYRCFPGVRRMGIRVENINDLRNGITLERNIHYAFGKFEISFVAMDTPDHYTIKTYPGCPSSVSDLFAKDSIVQFQKATGAKQLPLPDPAALECHSRLAEIMHASGMGEYIDGRFRDWENHRGAAGQGHLAEDGSTDVEMLMKFGLWESVAA